MGAPCSAGNVAFSFSHTGIGENEAAPGPSSWYEMNMAELLSFTVYG